MCLWTVAKQNHKACQHSQCLNAELKILPSIVAGKEGNAEQSKDNNLHKSVVRKKNWLQPSCKKDADEVGIAMVTGYHVEHFLIQHKDVVKSSIDSRKQDKSCSAKDSISKVTPHLRIAEKDG